MRRTMMEYLKLKSENMQGSDMLNSDMHELKVAFNHLISDVAMLGGIGFGTSFLKWVASIAAILPSVIFDFFSGEFGKWVAFVAVVLRLFFNKRFPESLEMPGALILLLVVAPSLLADTFRDDWIGTGVCLLIGCYLLQEHIRASGGFRASFTQSHGISNTVGIILLLVYPVWALVLRVV